ncbi:MAG: YicC family protein [Clostridiales bacterium]|nr:YicC family protein [Clostridiales bacterium]MCI2191146.1 YicC family protein [Oscillospiraceae bacterium]CAB1249008.1 Protein YicC [Ruminococcaceae bacterium BL-4]MCI1960430.1 YicC family protein [Clostridiales bacterium]MCI2020917.1 YicC family protein [Clostridiales bacterium]
MLKSMTGFGRMEAVKNGREISVEIKSVNHRYFEFSSRISRGYDFLESKLKTYLQKKLFRGKVEAFVSIETLQDTAAQVHVNYPLAESYLKSLRELRDRYDLRDDISVMAVSRYPDILTVEHEPEDEEALWNDVKEVAEGALGALLAMREAEGVNLKKDVLSRAECILQMVQKVEERSPQTVAEYNEKLIARLHEILGDTTVDEERLLTEAAIFADKVAVAEETVRLRSHFDQFKKLLDSEGPIGRKLDFLVQEMNREANTIGSKACDTQIAYLVVDIKAEIEKIREQIQNIE